MVKKKKEAPQGVVRVAEQPEQTLNIDLLFVPEQHAVEEKLPAVSGSSGRLIVARTEAEKEAAHWPGLVFGNREFTYEEAMEQYASETRDRLEHRKPAPVKREDVSAAWREEWQARSERYQVRRQREQEDLNWKTAKAEWRKELLVFRTLPQPERKLQQARHDQIALCWKLCRTERKEATRQRQQDNLNWHKCNQEVKEHAFPERTWIAVLAIVDNCSRQCLGLPIFRAGAHVTSDEVVAALRMLLPANLAFLISDQGTHFRSKVFAQLAKDQDFIHIPIYRHRPESNGIAERFVLTFKGWLQSKSWQDVAGLQLLAGQFEPEYNERPHQGLQIPGLSPNEFAKRIWVS